MTNEIYEQIKQEYQELEKQLIDPAIFSDMKKMASLSKKQSEMREVVQNIEKLEKVEEDIKQNAKMIKEEKDQELREMAEIELEELSQKKQDLEKELQEQLRPKNPLDKKSIIMEIRAGAGGDESALFAAELFRMYSKFAEKNRWSVNILNSSQIGIGGFKEVVFEINGSGVYGELKHESGTHRVQRVPETEKQGRVHTSTATVAVMPEAEEVDIEIRNEDIRIDTFCSSGPGGQSVNTTYSAIRITHEPTGLIVSCQDQKSQHQNKEKAMQVLRSRLLAKQEDDRRQKEAKERNEQIGTGDRSEKIRTYNFPQDRITDHRIKKSWHSIDRIMDGEIEDLIKSLKVGLQRN